MEKVNTVSYIGLLAVLLLAGCSEKPAATSENTVPSTSGKNAGASVEQQAAASSVPDATKPATQQPGETASPSPPLKQQDVALLRTYFELIASGERNKADLLAIRTEADCALFMLPENCSKILEGQLEIQKTLDADPIPLNSVIIEMTEGQEQNLDGKGGFLAGTTLWIGQTIRARGPGGKEFIMRSMGVVERNGNYRIIWGKRRSLKDTRRSPHLTPPSQPASEAK